MNLLERNQLFIGIFDSEPNYVQEDEENNTAIIIDKFIDDNIVIDSKVCEDPNVYYSWETRKVAFRDSKEYKPTILEIYQKKCDNLKTECTKDNKDKLQIKLYKTFINDITLDTIRGSEITQIADIICNFADDVHEYDSSEIH